MDPGTETRRSSVEVFDLVGGAYRWQRKAVGDEAMTVPGSVAMTLIPAALVRADE